MKDRNIVFASKNYFDGQTLSRRDDIIAVVYNLLFMMDQNDFEFSKLFIDRPYEEAFKLIKAYKLTK
jgi:hypothetical protein